MPAECARNINLLGSFCGMRDVPALTRQALLEKYGFDRADVMVLFGGSILCGADVLAQAMRNGVAGKYIIVGGEGHTTQALRDLVHGRYPEIETDGVPEAEVFARCLQLKYGLQPDFLECASTNCGNNITYLLDLLRENGIPMRSIILTQDATMQRRMDAGMRKWAPDVQIINYASYAVRAQMQDGGLTFDNLPEGMWSMERYVELLMGEIPRLSDDAEGYGPCGKDFIAHMDIPSDVRAAFEALQRFYGAKVRPANEQYASRA